MFLRTFNTLFFLLLFGSICNAQNYRSGELLVQFNEEVNIESILQKYPTVSLNKLCSAEMRIYSLAFDERKSDTSLMNALKRDPNILHIQRNHFVEFRNRPNDAQYNMQSTLFEQINAPDVWEVTTGGTTSLGDTIVVAIIDRGIDIDHEDLKDNLWTNQHEIPGNGIDDDGNGYVDDYYGYNFTELNDIHPDNGHGNAVAGLVGAVGNNDVGVVGVNWDVKMMFLSGARVESEVIEAYDYILTQRKRYNQTNGALGAFIVATNASFGITGAQPEDFPLWCDIYDRLGFAGILNVAATANSELDVDIEGDMPTACGSDFLISVTNVDREDQLSFAAFGKTTIDIGAPGDNSFTTWGDNSYNDFGGTSGATPLVAGAIGLLYSLDCDALSNLSKSNPALTAFKIKAYLLEGSRKVNSLDAITVSGGVLDLKGTVDAMKRFCEKPDPGRPIIYSLYPNPVDNKLFVEYGQPTDEDITFLISNTLGQQIAVIETPDFHYGKLELEIDVSNLRPGLYFISLLRGHASTHAFVVERED